MSKGIEEEIIELRRPILDQKSQLQEYGKRFFYAAAAMPPEVIEGFLGLLESYSTSKSNPLSHKLSARH